MMSSWAGSLAPIEILDELEDAALVVERFAVAGAMVAEDDLHAAIEKGQFLQAAVEHVVVELGVGEDLRVGLEGGLGAGAGRCGRCGGRRPIGTPRSYSCW